MSAEAGMLLPPPSYWSSGRREALLLPHKCTHAHLILHNLSHFKSIVVSRLVLCLLYRTPKLDKLWWWGRWGCYNNTEKINVPAVLEAVLGLFVMCLQHCCYITHFLDLPITLQACLMGSSVADSSSLWPTSLLMSQQAVKNYQSIGSWNKNSLRGKACHSLVNLTSCVLTGLFAFSKNCILFICSNLSTFLKKICN